MTPVTFSSIPDLKAIFFNSTSLILAAQLLSPHCCMTLLR
uniref:Uncharacterized protein n=2 Tax=Anguilla anguilla TaxID=7936 RepID=A0A0E9UYB8_ANGAN